MIDWVNMVARMERIKQAREDFLLREFVDRAIIGPMLLDRVAADLSPGNRYGSQGIIPSLQSMTRNADDRYMRE